MRPIVEIIDTIEKYQEIKNSKDLIILISDFTKTIYFMLNSNICFAYPKFLFIIALMPSQDWNNPVGEKFL